MLDKQSPNVGVWENDNETNVGNEQTYDTLKGETDLVS